MTTNNNIQDSLLKDVKLEELKSVVRTSNATINSFLGDNPSFNCIVSEGGDIYYAEGYDPRQLKALLSLLVDLQLETTSYQVKRGVFDSYLSSKKSTLSEIDSSNNGFSQMLVASIKQRTTDIHINIKSADATIQFKIDGFVYVHQVLTREVSYKFIQVMFQSYIKCNFEIHEEQDVTFPFIYKNRKFQFRGHARPGFNGTIVVLRCIEQGVFIGIEEGGYHAQHHDHINTMLSHSTGFACISGITNSGKSSLYRTLLRDLPDHFIKTELANPIEMEINGVEQINLSGESEDVLEQAIISILRMDPNYIFLSEVRGKEAAKLLISAALVGQFVLTTIHSGKAELFFLRLMGLGIPRDNLMMEEFFRGFMVQTLMPRVCPNCKTDSPEYLDKDIAKKKVDLLKKTFDNPFYFRNVRGCKMCNGRGTQGQIVVAEGFSPDFSDNTFVDMIKHSRFSDIANLYMRPRKILTQMEHAAIHVHQGLIDPIEAERKRSKFVSKEVKEAFKWAL